jgi:hypothetical protein
MAHDYARMNRNYVTITYSNPIYGSLPTPLATTSLLSALRPGILRTPRTSACTLNWRNLDNAVCTSREAGCWGTFYTTGTCSGLLFTNCCAAQEGAFPMRIQGSHLRTIRDVTNGRPVLAKERCLCLTAVSFDPETTEASDPLELCSLPLYRTPTCFIVNSRSPLATCSSTPGTYASWGAASVNFSTSTSGSVNSPRPIGSSYLEIMTLPSALTQTDGGRGSRMQPC